MKSKIMTRNTGKATLRSLILELVYPIRLLPITNLKIDKSRIIQITTIAVDVRKTRRVQEEAVLFYLSVKLPMYLVKGVETFFAK
jgi:hypothetical protein